MKFMVWLGGPFHGLTDWVHEPAPENVLLCGLKHYAERGFYRYVFGDAFVLIYYWNVNDFQRRAIEQQVEQLRARHGELAVE